MLSFHTYEYLMVLGLYLCAVHHSNPAPARPAHLLSHYTLLTQLHTYYVNKQQNVVVTWVTCQIRKNDKEFFEIRQKS